MGNEEQPILDLRRGQEPLSAGIMATAAENRPEDLRFRVPHLPFRQLK